MRSKIFCNEIQRYQEIRVNKPGHNHPKIFLFLWGGSDQKGLLFILLNLIRDIDSSIFMHVYSSKASGCKEQLDRLLINQQEASTYVLYMIFQL